ncbi:MAG: PspC domain-containing protein [Alistipes sp.]|jgi:phage shock protein PspC (stress-responsive transcriptional regulator)|uniref:PspC domain-containing protein n=1 Tax=uncultured Alistipes sp. TaxID=538949 RepID=UPI0025913450|nr:PspC domain-containing protein [uncultured Alistipes sp.]MCI9244546.1 PspC domain-containing protein [Alistipes sp.]
MNEVRKCSLSGVAFTMDADAFALLAEYIETLKKSYEDSADGDEIVADIEARIAELILSAQDNTRVVERPLVENIIRQMGSAEDISETDPAAARRGGPRIPRRLYRDRENAKLGGVCAGIGKYFDVDPVWVRLALFLPLLLLCLQWIPFFGWWVGPMMGNLFGIFIICYLIMWFAVPTARTARQKLEMNGERITEQAIRRTTEQTAAQDPDSRTKPVVAEAVSAIGKIVLMLCKLFAGLLVFGLILGACALIIALFAILVGGHDMPLSPHFLNDMNLGIPILGILLVLIPVILLIYVLMCLIASRKPGSKTLLAIFLTWIAGLAMLIGLAYKEKAVDRVRNYQPLGQILNKEVVIESDTTTLRQILREFDDEKIVEDDLRSVHISVPSKGIEITYDKQTSQLDIEADGKRIRMQADESDGAYIRVDEEEMQQL